MTGPELSRRRADMLRSQGLPWVPPHTVRTYGLFKQDSHDLVALVVSSSFDTAFHWRMATELGYRVLMLVEYDITKVPGAVERLRAKLQGGR